MHMALELSVALDHLVHAVMILCEQRTNRHLHRTRHVCCAGSIACEHGESRRSSAFSTQCSASHSVARRRRMNAAAMPTMSARRMAGEAHIVCLEAS